MTKDRESDSASGRAVTYVNAEQASKMGMAGVDPPLLKAKAAPSHRSCPLYDKLSRWDVLAYAYLRCKANQGAAGVEGQTFADIEAYGERQWLEELAKELQSKTYQCSPVKRVWIPKPDGKQRPLGILSILDRVILMAA